MSATRERDGGREPRVRRIGFAFGLIGLPLALLTLPMCGSSGSSGGDGGTGSSTSSGSSGGSSGSSSGSTSGSGSGGGSSGSTSGSTSGSGSSSGSSSSGSTSSGSTSSGSSSGSTSGSSSGSSSGGTADGGGDDGGGMGDDGGGDGQILPFSLSSNDLMPTGGAMPPTGGLCFKNGQTHNTGDMSPALSWAGAPAGTMSFALSLNDTNNGLTHWVMYDIPANVMSLPASLPQGAMPPPPAPAGSKQKGASFDTNNDGFFGPGADYHTYEFKLWAINSATLPVSGETTDAMYMTLLPANSIGSTTLLVCGDINALCNATCP